MPGPSKINLIRPDGKVVSATEADARLLLGLGYRPEEPEEADARITQTQRESDYSGVAQGALAFGEGVVGGILPGADYLMADEGTRARADLHGTARFLGELGGSIMPFAPAAKLGKAVLGGAERVVGKGLASKAASGIAEGAAFGAQTELTRASLSGDPVTAEQVLAGMGLGAVFGGGAMSLAHGMEKIAARAKGGAKSVRELAAEFTPAQAKRAGDFPQFDNGGMNPYDTNMGGVVSGGADIPYTGGKGTSLWDDVASDAAPGRFTPDLPSVAFEPTAVHAQDNAARGVIAPEAWTRLRTASKEAYDVADNLATEMELAHDRALIEFQKVAPGRDAKFKTYADEVMGTATFQHHSRKGTLNAPKAKTPGSYHWPAGQGDILADDAAGVTADMIADARAKYRAASAATEALDGHKALEAKQAYEAAIKDLAKRSGMPEFVELAKPAYKRVSDVHDLMGAVRVLKETLPSDPTDFFVKQTRSGEKIHGALSAIMASKVPEAAAIQASLKGIVEEMVAKSGLAHPGSVADQLRALGEVGHGAVTRAGQSWQMGEHALKLRTSKAGPVSGWSAKDVPITASNSRKAKPSTAFDDGVDADLGDVDWGDAPSPEVAVKSKQGKRTLGESVARIARRESAYAAASAATGVAPRHTMRSMTRYSLIALFMGAKGLAMEGAKDAGMRVLGSKAAAKVVSKVGPRAFGLYRSATGHEDSAGDLTARFRARSAELRDLAVAGRDQAFAFSQELAAAGHPEFAHALYTAATRAQDAVITRLPKDPPGTRWGTEWIWDAPPEQVEVFAQEYCAAFSPLEFLEAVAEDPESVHPSAISVLQDAWPGVYSEFRSEALNALMMTGTEGMDADRLTSLSLLLDAALSPTNDPQFIASHQAMYAPENQPQPPQGGGASGTPGRPPGNDATAMQRLSLG